MTLRQRGERSSRRAPDARQSSPRAAQQRHIVLG